MNPRVSSAAFLISGAGLAEFAQRLGMSSSHSFLGISMAAMVATALATYFLTTEEGEARLARIACLIWDLKSPFRDTQ